MGRERIEKGHIECRRHLMIQKGFSFQAGRCGSSYNYHFDNFNSYRVVLGTKEAV